MDSISITCVSCGARYQFSSEQAGRKFRCKKCETVNVIEEAPPPASASRARSAAGARNTVAGARPSRQPAGERPHGRHYGEQAPQKPVPPLFLGLGVLAIVVAGVCLWIVTSKPKVPPKKPAASPTETASKAPEPPAAAPAPAPEPAKPPEPAPPAEAAKAPDAPKAADAPKKAEAAPPPEEKPKAATSAMPGRFGRVEVKQLDHRPDTPPELRTQIDEHIANLKNPDLTKEHNRATDALEKIGKPAVPRLIGALADVDVNNADQMLTARMINGVLRKLCRATYNFPMGEGPDIAKQSTHTREMWFQWWRDNQTRLYSKRWDEEGPKAEKEADLGGG
jgi:hypothetical protein